MRSDLGRAVVVEWNTFVRVGGAIDLPGGPDIAEFSRNIVTGGGGVALVNLDVVECNDLWGNGTNWVGPDQSGQNGNISAPPLYCDAAGGVFTLAANSPCLPATSPCGLLIGALGQGCGATAVAQRSWGSIKGLYR